MKPRKVDAISALEPSAGFSFVGDVITEWRSEQPQPSVAEIDAKLVELEDDWTANEYARNRASEYPSVQECVHAILDDQLDALQAKRAEIKTKYPKGG